MPEPRILRSPRSRTHLSARPLGGAGSAFPGRRVERLALAVALVASILFVALIASRASAQDGRHAGGAHGAEVALGLSYTSSDHFEVDSAALRWNRHVRGPWSFEVSLSTDDVGELGESSRFLELSARRQFLGEGRWRLLGFAGLGAIRYDDFAIAFLDGITGEVVPFPGPSTVAFALDREDTTDLAAHVGAAFEFDFTQRTYLRTDLRLRRVFDSTDAVAENSAQSTVGVGWRF